MAAADTIFDRNRISADLHDAITDDMSPKEIRAATVSCLAAARKSALAVIAEAIAEDPYASQAAVRSYTYLCDCLVHGVFDVAVRHIHPPKTRKEAEQLSVVAVGGYGRAEMAPFSDVDLLFLTPWKTTAWAESMIETMLYMLWDLRLKVGHASRTVQDCIRLGRDDYTIRTSLLEKRFLDGNAELAETLRTRLREDLFRTTAADFIEAKLTEREQRHRKQGGQRYVVEPNVKEGKGGLRDLQSLYWIAKYVHSVDNIAELVDLGVFTQAEFDNFRNAERFLWAVRNQLHLISRRAMDQLTFDIQVQVAEALGYEDYGGRRAVEHFMQDYFRHATRVGELTRIFLTALEADHTKRAPSLVGFLRRGKKVRPGFRMVQNRLTYEDADAFLSDKLNILRLFEEALRTAYLIHPDAMRLVSANLDLIDDDMRRNPEATRLFLDTLLKHGNPDRALRRMNELGVLGAFIPEFQPVVAMMQYNLYHQYTVDEHTIQCIATLSRIERGKMAEDLPFATRILKEGKIDRKVLYLALFLHDIGKGRKEDHSILGARIARKVAPRLGLKKDDCETVEWLVRYHLLMSDMAQKRDLSDPRTIRDFAKAVKTQKRLDLLSVLTTCDIIGVGPGVWNNWKAQLMRDLYRQTSTALSTGLEEINRESRQSEAKAALRAALPDWTKAELRAETARHYGPYWQGLQTETHVVMARMLREMTETNEDKVGIDLQPDPDRDATRICFAMPDHPGIFARLAGSLALVGANVVDARSYTSKDGYATAAFWVQDADGHPYQADRLERLKTTIHKTLSGELVTSDAVRRRDKIKKRERNFVFPTSITFDNEGSEIYTIIEVDTRDRAGLLFDLTRVLASANVYISSAQIATYGAQVVDTFYVKDMFGLKLISRAKQEALEARLREAIETGARAAAE
ncbi:MAG: [protein-PII] uridylyltransferase [Rhodobacteraceae bacterium]|nr:[protein-PII] uridylyltransferase [Paracoccaceae bacterium]